MNRLTDFLRKDFSSKSVAVVIVIAGILIPAYLLRNVSWSETEFSFSFILLPALYLVAVISLALLAAGYTGKELSTKEADEKFIRSYHRFMDRLTPLWWVLSTMLLVWISYLAWTVYHELGYK